MPPDYCPNCGTDVPDDARVCPECGADEDTGWSDKAHTERLGIPDEDFNYDRFVEEEFGEQKPKNSPAQWLWKVVAVILLILMLTWLL